jgi:hypothetical protein
MYTNGNGGGRRNLSPWLVYGAIAVALLIGIYLVLSLLTAGFNKHFALVAGLLLLLINARELMQGWSNRDIRMPLANALMGVALVFVWLTAISALFWLPAIGLAIAAVPLGIGRATATSYIGAARSAAERVQRSVSRARLN